MPKTTCDIEFFGGPLDGHRCELRAGLDSLELRLAMQISRNTFQAMAGKSPRPPAFPTSTAIYELDLARGVPVYCFVKAHSARNEPVGRRRTLARYLRSALSKVIGRRSAHGS